MSRHSRLNLIGLFTVVIFGAVILHTSVVKAAPDFPKPSTYQISWELDFKHATPKRIAVGTNTTLSPKAYWYMTYTVTNNTDKEQKFYPVFDMLTDDGKVAESDSKIPKEVYDAIKVAENSKSLEAFNTINGPVRLGPAEARDGVAVWPETNLRMGHFSIFVRGLSGEAIIMKMVDGKYTKVEQAKDLYSKEDDEQYIKKNLVIFRKTLQLNYFLRDDEVYPGQDEVNKDGEEWIMR